MVMFHLKYRPALSASVMKCCRSLSSAILVIASSTQLPGEQICNEILNKYLTRWVLLETKAIMSPTYFTG